MNDYRENMLREFKNALITNNYFPDDICKITDIFIGIFDKYEISPRVTTLVEYDTSTEELIKYYIGSLLTEGKSKKTCYMYMRILNRFHDDLGKPLLEVTVFDIRGWMAKQQKNISLRTLENYRSYLSSFYNWALKEDLIEKNPMQKINPITFQEKVKSTFTDVEIDKIRENCKTLRERAEVELLLSSGARVSELTAMNINDINLTTHDVVIRHGKGNKERVTYMTDVCAYHLARYLESRNDNDIALFVNKFGTRIGKNSIENDMRKLAERTSIERVHPHKFRRQFGTDKVKRGMDIRTVQLLMGHSDINTTTTYTVLSNQHVKNEYMRYC